MRLFRKPVINKENTLATASFHTAGNGEELQEVAETPELHRFAQLEEQVRTYRTWLQKIEAVAEDGANGNLEARLLHLQEAGDFAVLANSVNHLLDMTDAFLREAGATLEHASHGKFYRRVLLRGMLGTFRHKSQLINDAIERMAANTASLKEVERLVQQSAEIATGAAEESRQANVLVKQLSDASAKIDRVVKFISQIAWKTSLLSMNATIEAARAGDAGLGFGVVAQEVKDLAEQTSVAADEIAREIGVIGTEVNRTAQAIGAMDQTISKLKEISATIEQSVIKQTVKAGEAHGPAHTENC